MIEWEELYYIPNIGTLTFRDENVYISSSSGYCGSNPPTHTQGVRSDGGVDWIFLEKKKSTELNLYLFTGGQTEWDDDSDPPVPEVNNRNIQKILGEIIAFEKITQNDIRLCIDRVDWKVNTLYEEYTDTGTQRKPYFIMNSQRNIYLCLSNFDGALSQIEPTSLSDLPIVYGDGYTWKFMYSVSPNDTIYFMTPRYAPISLDLIPILSNLPVKSISRFDIVDRTEDQNFNDIDYSISGDGSGLQVSFIENNSGSTTGLVITDFGSGYTEPPILRAYEYGSPGTGAVASAEITSGHVVSVTVSNSGSNYAYAKAYAIGDGSGAVLECTIDMGIITAIEVLSYGSGYTYADIIIVPGERSLVARGVMSPINGHGFNILQELDASTVIINSPVPQNTYFDMTVFRQAGLINNCVDQSGDSFTDARYIGQGHSEYSNSSSTMKKHDGTSGEILMLENFEKISREPGQEERIKLIINF